MNLENLTLTGSALNGNGNSQDNIISGNSFDNKLDGDSGNDTIYGGTGNDTLNGGYGNDAMYGGTGNDAYLVDSAFDSVTEYVAEGIDTVYSSISYSLGINLENLTLTDSASHGYGNSLDNILTGNIYNNSLDGGAGNDTLDGGLGSDSLSGGVGNDAYLVDSASDSVTEFIAEGTDTVYASVSYTLGINLENLVLTGTATNGYGNTLDNVLIGNIYNNILDGGTGNDALYGGVGNDVYYIDSSLDSAIENAAEGTDTVYASLSYSLGINLENLTLTGTALNGNGNTLDNIITGNSGNNILDGGYGNDTLIGDTGNDTMYGRTGNDVYYVDSYSDSVTENAAEGTDTVFSSISYTLGVNLENLTLTGTATNGYGNILDNVITGNSYNNDLNGGEGNDTLIGYGGGQENDYLSGGFGADTFALGNLLGAFYQGGNSGNGYAIVTDYSYGQGDKIQLYGNSHSYTFTSSNYGGSAATDILISYGSDMVGIVYDTTAISYSYV
jgi:Ca2+-binding RTX toxin-like protein